MRFAKGEKVYINGAFSNDDPIYIPAVIKDFEGNINGNNIYSILVDSIYSDNRPLFWREKALLPRYKRYPNSELYRKLYPKAEQVGNELRVEVCIEKILRND